MISRPSRLSRGFFSEKKFDAIKFFLSFVLCLTSYISANAQSGEWTWIKGDSTINPSGSFGTQGVPDPQNNPPGFYESAEWKDLDGNLWLFGGVSSSFVEFGDLWKYNIASNEWTWMKGSGLSSQPGMYGTLGVPSSSNLPGTRAWGVATWVGLDGSLWLYGGLGMNSQSHDFLADLWKYNIATNEWTWVSGSSSMSISPDYGTQGVSSPANTPGSRAETNATWVDSLGNLWLFGGLDGSNSYNDLWKFDITTLMWTWMKGFNGGNQAGTYGTLGIADPSNTPGARFTYGKWKDQYGKFWLFGGYNGNSFDFYDDVWKYDPMLNEWTWESGSNQPNASDALTSNCNPDISNHPSGRHESRACCSDCAGHFWTFGGEGPQFGIYSDLWLFDSNNLQWTLVNGDIQTSKPGIYGIQGIASPGNYPKSRWGGLSWMDDNCRIWLWGGAGISVLDRLNDLWKFIPDPNCPSTVTCSSSCLQSAVAFSSSATSICEKFCINFFDSSANNPASWQWIFPGGAPSSSSDQNPTNICYDTPGVYDVTLITTNANGSDTLTLHNYINVYATPPFPSISQVGYTLTSSPASSYQWQLNSINIPGATNQSYTIMQTGLYTVIVSDSNGCVNSANQYVLISGIDEVNDSNISIHPNPSNGNFIVELLQSENFGEVSIDILNTLGQKNFSSAEKISSHEWKKEIDLHTAASGVYFIEIKTEKEFVRKKILITK